MIKSFSAKNETFKNKVAILIVEAKNDKECCSLGKEPTSGEGLLQAKGKTDW